MTGVQFEPGPVATPFEHRPYSTELAMCQRYYIRSTSASSNFLAAGYAKSAGEAFTGTTLPVTQRVQPTFSSSSASTFAVGFKNTAKVCSSVVGSTTTDLRTVAISAATSGLTAGESVAFLANGVCWIAFDAEL